MSFRANRRSMMKRRESVALNTSRMSRTNSYTAADSPRKSYVGDTFNTIANNTEPKIKMLGRFNAEDAETKELGNQPSKDSPGSGESNLEERVCRICLCEEDDPDDPIIATLSVSRNFARSSRIVLQEVANEACG